MVSHGFARPDSCGVWCAVLGNWLTAPLRPRSAIQVSSRNRQVFYAASVPSNSRHLPIVRTSRYTAFVSASELQARHQCTQLLRFPQWSCIQKCEMTPKCFKETNTETGAVQHHRDEDDCDKTTTGQANRNCDQPAESCTALSALFLDAT